MIINSIIAGVGGGGTPANMRTYNITAEVTWSNFFTDSQFQLLYKNSEITIFVTGSTAPSAGATTTRITMAQLNSGTVKSKLYRNSYGSIADPKTPNQAIATSLTFQTEAATAYLADTYWGITNAGIFTAGSNSINSLVPANATVVISEAPLSSDLWGT